MGFRRRGKNVFIDEGQRASRRYQSGNVSALSSATTMPLRARSIAGRSKSERLNLPEPYFASASANPAGVPGTPMPSAESRDLAMSGLPSDPRKISGVVAAGAVSR